jgi:hypothetical protein
MVPRKLIVLDIKMSDRKALSGQTEDAFGRDICEECGRADEDCTCVNEGSERDLEDGAQ